MFSLRCKPGADNPNAIFLSVRIDHHYDPAGNGSDADESVFSVGMSWVKDFQMAFARFQELPRFGELQTMLRLVASTFGLIPFDFHTGNHGSMTYSVNGL